MLPSYTNEQIMLLSNETTDRLPRILCRRSSSVVPGKDMMAFYDQKHKHHSKHKNRRKKSEESSEQIGEQNFMEIQQESFLPDIFSSETKSDALIFEHQAIELEPIPTLPELRVESVDISEDLTDFDFSEKPASLKKLLQNKSASVPSTSTRAYRTTRKSLLSSTTLPKKKPNTALREQVASWLISPQRIIGS
jgi:hypothetical protein